ncbi:hypothetical protein M404DRAFT_997727 [Pisolithus tinctorius Marx 270]|uniref:Uncharacterized protein n=1 Tax=Pisolithus tinctorius Marx 270 TaxID=870435 RepID=A0A0C3P3D2_PISTI|nr:hypothetical protein M404DRAFT_997727 [Pisolithus tinctorius Marx 270]
MERSRECLLRGVGGRVLIATAVDIQYQEGRNAIAAPKALACVPISDWHPPHMAGFRC